MRVVRWATALALCAIAAPGLARAAVTQDNFLLNNTSDFVALCTAEQSDPLYTAAVNFCHGFAVGVYRVLSEEDAASSRRHMFCPKDPMPSRNEAVASFVAWLKANPAQMDAQPADSIAAYLVQTYPCPQPTATSRRTHQ